MKGWSSGLCGVTQSGGYCTRGSGLVSGKSAQYYGLCSVPKVLTPSLLASDSSSDFYKVPVPHGVKMIEGTVKDICKTAGMKPVCFHKNINVDGCVTMAEPKKSWPMHDLATPVCNTTW